MRVFATKTVSRFLKKERVSSESLIHAVNAIEQGLIHADLGGGLIKQRVARRGQGKSGGYRMLIAFRSQRRAIFLFGFAKNERDNIDAAQLATLRDIGAIWLAATDMKLSHALDDGILFEVTDAHKS